MTHNHFFVIMTSSLMSVASNDTPFNWVFYSASIGTYHVTLTSIFWPLPVSTYSDLTFFMLKTQKFVKLLFFLSKLNEIYVNRRVSVSWSFFINMFIYLSSPYFEKTPKTIFLILRFCHYGFLRFSRLWDKIGIVIYL